jgi:hypothetical protein
MAHPRHPLLHLGLMFGLLSMAPARGAPEVPDGITMHRLQAGSPDPDGWYSATSTNGRFSVRLPIPFNDFSVPADKGSPNIIHAIGSKSKEGVKFGATRVPIIKPRKSCDDFLQQFPRDFENKKVLISKRRFQVDGREALDCAVKKDTSQALFRVVCLKDGAMVMSVEFPLGLAAATVEPLARKFFESVRIEDGGAKVASGIGSPAGPVSPASAGPR